MDEGQPQTAAKKDILDGVRISVFRDPEIDSLPGGVGFHQDGEELSLFTADNLGHRPADGRSDQERRVRLVRDHGAAGQNAVALLHEQSRKEPRKIGGFDGYGLRKHLGSDLTGRGTLQRNVEALFQIERI